MRMMDMDTFVTEARGCNTRSITVPTERAITHGDATRIATAEDKGIFPESSF